MNPNRGTTNIKLSPSIEKRFTNTEEDIQSAEYKFLAKIASFI